MIAHLPVLQVLVPLLAAPLCATMRKGRAAWAVAVAASWTSLWIAIQLLLLVLTDGPISYELGGWAAPWGIEYRIDIVSAFVLVIVSTVAALVTPYALKSVEREVEASRVTLFYAAFMLCLAGLLGITVTGDVFNVFVFLEISSLAAYALIAIGQDRKALTAAYQYLIMGSVGATFIVIGIGMMYVMTGSLNMADLSVLLPQVSSYRTIPVAFAFLTVGISLKLALFPLHLWLPNAYTYAPSTVTAFMASTATKVAIYMLLRFFFTVFGPAFSFDVMQLDRVLLPLALLAMFSMSLVAIFQTNIKRMLAYSSVAQIGYMILGISMASVTGLTAGILHLFNHAMIKGALFMALGCVMYRVGSVHIDSMRGLGKRMPWTMAAFVVAGLSLIGVPLTVGFVSKWYLIQGALEKGWWPVAVLILITSLMAVVYIWRVVEAAYFQEFPGDDDSELGEAPLAMLLPTWALILINLYFGIDASHTAGIAGAAARSLLGVGP
ncbi:MAG: monovalent cation/H+ antiporter subunit D family protein [Gemmatimonadota bacterium]|nr:MAG: monovalent cation/H+ antiporter subunit D family protein [Gemmatimonadota bacterium]